MLHLADKQPTLASEESHLLPPRSTIFGRSPAMQEIAKKVEKVANINVPVLIQGESGTGKEIIARLIHCYSRYRAEPFVRVNCPGIPETLLESELFGYERGAFTGAYNTKPGQVELAHRGTLFMDEIGELAFGLQAKLLQLLQDGQFSRIGAQENRRVDVRVICATNRNLEAEVAAGHFREDVYYRINVVSLQLPPLRDRREDIPDLIECFLRLYKQTFNHSVAPLPSNVMQLMMDYQWPGNIRQLENMIKRYVILASTEEIISDLIVDLSQTELDVEVQEDGSVPLKRLSHQVVQNLERKVILQVLRRYRWNRRRAARTLGISYRALLYKIRQAGLTGRAVSPAADRAIPIGRHSLQKDTPPSND